MQLNLTLKLNTPSMRIKMDVFGIKAINNTTAALMTKIIDVRFWLAQAELPHNIVFHYSIMYSKNTSKDPNKPIINSAGLIA